MPQVQVIQPIQQQPKRLRVAAYARVSSDSEDQLNSLAVQVDYYTHLIQENPNWEFAGIYTDEGITGTSTKRREQFNRLMDVGGVFERGDEHLGRAFYHGRFGYLVDDGVQQRDERVGRLVPFVRHPALFGRAVDGLVVELLLGGVERKHKVENLFVHHFGAAVGLIDLVHDDDGFLAQRQRFLQYEARLGHGAFERIDQQQHAVAHVQDALHLAAEVLISSVTKPDTVV